MLLNLPIILSSNSFLFHLLFPFLFSSIGQESSCLKLQTTMHPKLLYFSVFMVYSHAILAVLKIVLFIAC